MELEEFKEKMNSYLEEINIKLNEEQIKQFYDYMNLLLEWNEKINLTAITDKDEIILKHFVDCLTILKYIKENACIIDVGTGAGFPGIPLKIARKDLKIVLMDSLNKRINFLNEVIKNLKLENIETIHSRAEELGKNKKYRETFDVATSRAVANLNTLSEYMLPFVKKGGMSICMKGPGAEEEVQKAKRAISILGGKVDLVDSFDLPNSDIARNVVIINKNEVTPGKYPRKAGTPAKEPLFI